MHLRFQRWHVIPSLLLLISVGGATYVAYRMVGFFGVGILGLIIGVIAQNVELERGGPIGSSQATGVYSQYIAAEEHMSAAERAARRAEIESVALPLLVAKVVSAVLIVAGFGLFFVFQLGA